MIEVIVGCIVPLALTPNSLTEYKACHDMQYEINNVIEWHDTVDDYFAEEDILKALNIIHCESSGRSTVVGTNTDGSKDVGLWQFNDNTWAWLKSKLGIMGNRTNPEVATRYAAWLVYNDGWHHWNSSKHCWKGTDNDLLYYRKDT
jgi:hypothetical protein